VRGLTVLPATAALVAVASIAGGGASAGAAPRCFGAAARDAQHRCFNPTRSVTPAPAHADDVAQSPCTLTEQKPDPVCTFGVPAAKARAHFALIGDSHALHWRAALDVVAQAERWQGHSITTPACFYSEAVNALVAGLREPCVPWYRSAKRWFAGHPEVSTVFVSQNAPTPVVVAPGQTSLAIKVDGFRRAWEGLPKTVRHVVVIRDTPVMSDGTVACVRHVLAVGRQRPGPACPTPRAAAFADREDTAVAAVQAIGSKRFGAIDLTDFFCNRRECYPVIGGVLVHRDIDHITPLFAQTLGPFLLRRLRYLMASW
jgi:SGNH domain (fused to AT3 domains)